MSHQTVADLIAATTRIALLVMAALDTPTCETGVKVTDEKTAKLKLAPHSFHGEWNYTLSPRTS